MIEGKVVSGEVIHIFHIISLPLPHTPSPSATTAVYQTGERREVLAHQMAGYAACDAARPLRMESRTPTGF